MSGERLCNLEWTRGEKWTFTTLANTYVQSTLSGICVSEWGVTSENQEVSCVCSKVEGFEFEEVQLASTGTTTHHFFFFTLVRAWVQWPIPVLKTQHTYFTSWFSQQSAASVIYGEFQQSARVLIPCRLHIKDEDDDDDEGYSSLWKFWAISRLRGQVTQLDMQVHRSGGFPAANRQLSPSKAYWGVTHKDTQSTHSNISALSHSPPHEWLIKISQSLSGN